MRLVVLLWAALLAGACGDDEGGDDGSRSCGNSRCQLDTCETPLRCPEDCGACIGQGCDSGGTKGSCGKACQSSCDCVNQGELCTADYGVSPGTCVPADCLSCANFERCGYTPDASGLCATVQCS